MTIAGPRVTQSVRETDNTARYCRPVGPGKGSGCSSPWKEGRKGGGHYLCRGTEAGKSIECVGI